MCIYIYIYIYIYSLILTCAQHSGNTRMHSIVITVEIKLYIYIMNNIQKQEVLSYVPKWNKHRHSLRVWRLNS